MQSIPTVSKTKRMNFSGEKMMRKLKVMWTVMYASWSKKKKKKSLHPVSGIFFSSAMVINKPSSDHILEKIYIFEYKNDSSWILRKLLISACMLFIQITQRNKKKHTQNSIFLLDGETSLSILSWCCNKILSWLARKR